MMWIVFLCFLHVAVCEVCLPIDYQPVYGVCELIGMTVPKRRLLEDTVAPLGGQTEPTNDPNNTPWPEMPTTTIAATAGPPLITEPDGAHTQVAFTHPTNATPMSSQPTSPVPTIPPSALIEPLENETDTTIPATTAPTPTVVLGRKVTLTLKPGATCTGPQTIGTSVASCACSLSEYVPLFTPCVNGVRSIVTVEADKATKCIPDANVLSQMLLSMQGQVKPCACSTDMMGYSTSACNNGAQTLVAFWGGDCDATGLALPAPVQVGCSLVCNDGEYLAPPVPFCRPCPAGTYSFVGEEWNAPFTNIPSPFRTDCDGEKLSCPMWGVDSEGYLSPLSTTKSNDFVSTISFDAEALHQPADLSVTFRVSSEYEADYFAILLDGKAMFNTSGTAMEAWQTVVPFSDSSACASALHVTFFTSTANLKICLDDNQMTPFVDLVHLRNESAPTIQTHIVVVSDGCSVDNYDISATPNAVAVILWDNEDSPRCSEHEAVYAAQYRGAVAAIIVPMLHALQKYYHVLGVSHALTIPVLSVARHTSSTVRSFLAACSRDGCSAKLVPEQLPSAGSRVVALAYSKDFAHSAGRDNVQVRSIRFRGKYTSASSCKACEKGTFSTNSSSVCSSCPQNTFNNASLASFCQPCAPHLWSAERADRCVKRRECSWSDTTWMATKCLESEAFTTAKLYFIDTTCKIELSNLNANATLLVPCRRTDATPPRCVKGYAMQHATNYGFDALNGTLHGFFNTSCDGSVAGWKPAAYFDNSSQTLKAVLVVGIELNNAVARLSMDVAVESIPFVVSFEYGPFLQLSNANPTFSFTVVDVDTQAVIVEQERLPVEALNVFSRPSHFVFSANSMPINSTVRLVWSYSSNTESEFLLTKIVINGTGAAADCRQCPAGYYCNGVDGPLLCPAGAFCPRGSATFTMCPDGTFSSRKGGVECVPCESGTYSNVQHTQCFFRNRNLLAKISDQEEFNLSSLDCIRAKIFRGIHNTAFVDQDVVVDFSRSAEFVPAATVVDRVRGRRAAFGEGSTFSISRDLFAIRWTIIGGTCLRNSSAPLTLLMNLTCNKAATLAASAFETDSCHFALHWEAPAGCPLCTKAMIRTFGGCTHDDPRESAVVQYEYAADCVGGVGLPVAAIVTCHATHNLILIVGIVIAAVTGTILVGIILYLYRSRRKLYLQLGGGPTQKL